MKNTRSSTWRQTPSYNNSQSLVPSVEPVRSRLYCEVGFATLCGLALVHCCIESELQFAERSSSCCWALRSYTLFKLIEIWGFVVATRSRTDDDDIECNPRRLKCLQREISLWVA
jgi:hypothetical protein